MLPHRFSQPPLRGSAPADYGPPLLEATVAQRVIFPEAAARGLAVHEADPGGVADTEIREVTTELEATTYA